MSRVTRPAHLSQSLLINTDALAELEAAFPTLLEENYILKDDLKKAFELLGYTLAGYELRDLEKEIDNSNAGRISGENLMMLHAMVKERKDVGRTFKAKRNTKTDANLKTIVSHQQETSRHTVSRAEEQGFSNWMNHVLRTDPDCASYLPIDTHNAEGDLYRKCADGVLLCKLINVAVPDTVDMRVLNQGKCLSGVFKRNENLTLAVNSAESIGCSVVNIGPEDIAEGRRHLVLGLIWQVIRIGLLSAVNVNYHPDAEVLLEEGETLDDLRQLTPEELLLRWVNYHLQNVGSTRRIGNFKDDIMDSEVYANLLQEIAPSGVRDELLPVGSILSETDLTKRAEKVLSNADKLDARVFIQAEDISKANEKGINRDRLNLAFVANLFNNYPGFHSRGSAEIVNETLEERTYRNWMNSLGVTPLVKDLYYDLRNGLILLQIFDQLRPGSVDWKRVVRVFDPKRRVFQMQDNCSYVIQYMRENDLKVVNLSGEDIRNGERKLTLGICFQMVRAYTLKLLSKLRDNNGAAAPSKIEDRDIVQWANDKLRANGAEQSVISGFRDPRISTGRPVLDLVEAIQPNSVNYDLVTEGDNESNCKLAISLARRVGARVYALPQHLLEVNPKMTMTVFACLMVRDFQGK